jgi:hypothetical protein
MSIKERYRDLGEDSSKTGQLVVEGAVSLLLRWHPSQRRASFSGRALIVDGDRAPIKQIDGTERHLVGSTTNLIRYTFGRGLKKQIPII